MIKKIYISLLSCGVLGLVLLNSNAGGPANSGNRATGAPGDGSSSCVTCHNNSGVFGDVTIDLSFVDANGNTKTEYIPDSAYDLTITVNNEMGTPAGYGFQMICLDSALDNYDGWSNPSSNAQLTTSAGRNYVEHDGMSTTNEFTVEWTAPAEGTQYVTFYVGANAVNGVSGNSGDKAGLNEFTFSEAEGDGGGDPNSVDELDVNHFMVYPNPTSGLINVDAKNTTSFLIYNSQGQVIELNHAGGNQIDLSNQPTGFYIIENSESGQSQKVFKL